MADVQLLEAISLLTKVSADTSSMLKKLSQRVDGISSGTAGGKKPKKELVQKADPVIVTDFGKAAEQDLARLGGQAEKERQNTEKEKNKNSNLLKLLGLAGAAALAMKFLFDGEGFTGLVQGFQNAVKTVTKFADKAKGLIDDIGKRLGTFADDVGAKVGTIVDDVIAKTSQWAAKAKDGIKGAMDDIGKKLGSFGDDIARGVKSAITGAKSIASKVTEAAAGAGDDVARGSARAAATKPSLFGKLVSGAKSAGSSVASGAKAVGSRVVTGAKAAGRVAQKAGSFVKDSILKPVGNAIKKVKPLKLLKGLAKSPLLAPVLESFFAGKDIKDMIALNAAGEIDDDQLNTSVGNRLIKAVTGVLGGSAGAIIGGTLGSFIPIAGNILGAIAGGVLGDVGGRAIGGFLATAMGKQTGQLGEWALNTPLGAMMGAGKSGVENIEDGIITKDGKIIKPDSQDTLYAMKDGGPLGEALNKTPKMLGKLIEVEYDALNEMKKQNLLLRAILDKPGMGPLPSNGEKDKQPNFDQSGDSFRSLQMGY